MKNTVSWAETSIIIRIDNDCNIDEDTTYRERIQSTTAEVSSASPNILDPELTRSVDEAEQIQNELEKGMALIKSISDFWSFESELRNEFSDYESWNLPKLPQKEIVTNSDEPETKQNESSNHDPDDLSTIQNIKEIKLCDSDLMKICNKLSNYLNFLLSVPLVVRSDTLMTFLSIPNKKERNNKRSRFRRRHRRKVYHPRNGHESQNNTEQDNEQNEPMNNSSHNSHNQHINSLHLSDKTCYDYIFGDEIYKPMSNLEQNQQQHHNDQEFENGGIVTLSRRGFFSKTIQISSNHCLLWRFRILSGHASTVDFTITLLQDQLDHVSLSENDSEELTTLLDLPPSLNDTENNSMILAKTIYEEHSCIYVSSDSPPYQGDYHHDDVNINETQRESEAKITMTFYNTTSLFRSAQICYLYQVVPYDTYKAACTAADDQNLALKRKKYAPLMAHIWDSIHSIKLKVEPLFLDYDESKNYSEDEDITNKGKGHSSNKPKSTADVVFEEVLAPSWSEGSQRRPVIANGIQSTKSKNTAIKPFSTHHLQTIVKPHLDQIKTLRRQVHQLVGQYTDSQNELSIKTRNLQESNKMLYQLKEEKRQWSIAQKELEGTMRKLMGDLQLQRDQNLSKKELMDRLNKLEKENDELKATLEKERSHSKNIMEEMEKQLANEKSESSKKLAAAEMEADDAKMMKTVLEGKVREMERYIKDMDKELHEMIKERERREEDYRIFTARFDSLTKGGLSVPDEVPDYITMSFKHPNQKLDDQLLQLRDRYMKLFNALHESEEEGVGFDSRTSVKKNAILLQKIGLAVQEIILSIGDSQD